MRTKGVAIKEHEIRQLVDTVPVWFQPIRLGPLVAPAICDVGYMEWKASAIPDDLTAKSVLDVGASDGYYSFLAEARGATKVVAIDKYEGYKQMDPNQAFRVAKTVLNSDVEYRVMDFSEMARSDEIFEVTFFFDVLYHLPEPFAALRLLAKKTKEMAIISTVRLDMQEPVMYLYEPYELKSNDPNNWWAITPSCLKRLVMCAGFERMEEIGRLHDRILVRAMK